MSDLSREIKSKKIAEGIAVMIEESPKDKIISFPINRLPREFHADIFAALDAMPGIKFHREEDIVMKYGDLIIGTPEVVDAWILNSDAYYDDLVEKTFVSNKIDELFNCGAKELFTIFVTKKGFKQAFVRAIEKKEWVHAYDPSTNYISFGPTGRAMTIQQQRVNFATFVDELK